MLILGDENDTSIVPVVNLGLIFVCICAFIYEVSCSGSAGLAAFGHPGGNLESLITEHGLVPNRFVQEFGWREASTLITNVFLHGSVLHLIGNMWFLYIFGDNIEEHFGSFFYLLFFIACGVMGDLLTIYTSPLSTTPSIGASGAIAGVLGAYLILHPTAGIKTWFGDDSIFFAFRTYLIPAWVVIGGWFVLQYFCLYLDIPGIGWYAHIGGFTAGLIFTLIFRAKKEGTVNLKQAYGRYRLDNVDPSDPNYQASQDILATRGAAVFFMILLLIGGASWYVIKNHPLSPPVKAEHQIAKPAKETPTYPPMMTPKPVAKVVQDSSSQNKHRPSKAQKKHQTIKTNTNKKTKPLHKVPG